MALIEDFNEKAKNIIQNDSNKQDHSEDESIEIIELDDIPKDDNNSETFFIDGDILIDTDPDGDIGIDETMFGGSLIIDDEEELTKVVTEGLISSALEISDKDMKSYLDDDIMA